MTNPDPILVFLRAVLDADGAEELREELGKGNVVMSATCPGADAAALIRCSSAERVLGHLASGYSAGVLVDGRLWLVFHRVGALDREDPFRNNPLTSMGW